MSKSVILIWAMKIILAGLYIMVAIPKFGSVDLTMHIFQTLGIEPWGRYFTGVTELLVALLILIPATTIYGVALSIMTLLGAFAAHFFVIGIVVKNASGSINDGGEIFTTAIILLVLSIANLYIHRRSIPFIGADKS